VLIGALAGLGRVGSLTRRRQWGKSLLTLTRGAKSRGALALLLLGTFLLCCVAPLVPILRLSYDAHDVLDRISTLQSMLADGPSALLNVSKLDDLQSEVEAVQGDLREVNGAASLALAPVGSVSSRAEDLRLLVRMGAELTTSADEGLLAARIALTPLVSSALSDASDASGVTATDLAQAKALVTDAEAHVRTALSTYGQLDVRALPDQLAPGTHYGSLLARLPSALGAFQQLAQALEAAPQLLGIGQPAYYLITAMDRSELRPVGGLMGNYGILALQGGKQLKQYPLSLHNTYDLDAAYYQNPTLNSDPNPNDQPACKSSGPQAPEQFWWWPIRDFSCDYGWGLRDAGLSPDFPTNARMDMQIAEDADVVPGNAPLQGMIAFTPTVIEHILTITGPIHLPDFNTTVSADSLERQIHDFQLLGTTPVGQDRKAFTHELSLALLTQLRSLHGNALKPVLRAVEDAVKQKEIEIYLANPQAEGLLTQLGLSSALHMGGDGFYVVDTNDGGNKANLYVSAVQTDLVTLLPDGSALHQLQIAVTYNKTGRVYEGTTGFEDYSDVQRTYLPDNAALLGIAGFTPPVFAPAGCRGGGYASPITNCDRSRALSTPITVSDVIGRGMVMGPLLVTCGGMTNVSQYDPGRELEACQSNPTAQTVTLYLSWLTPHAFTLDAKGHGTYSELVEKQPGSVDHLTAYISTGALSTSAPSDVLAQAQQLSAMDAATRDVTYEAQLASAHQVFDAPLAQDTTITYHI
jgi:hypothetical protein